VVKAESTKNKRFAFPMQLLLPSSEGLGVCFFGDESRERII